MAQGPSQATIKVSARGAAIWRFTWEPLLPSSLRGLLEGFSSSWAVGWRPPSLFCYASLSIQQLTSWQLASLRASQRRVFGSDIPTLLPYLFIESTALGPAWTQGERTPRNRRHKFLLKRIPRHFSRVSNLVRSHLRQLLWNKHERSSSKMKTRETQLHSNQLQRIMSTHRESWKTPRRGKNKIQN